MPVGGLQLGVPQRHGRLPDHHLEHGPAAGRPDGPAQEGPGAGGAGDLRRPSALDGGQQVLLRGDGRQPGSEHGGGLSQPLLHPLSHLGQRRGQGGSGQQRPG